MGNKERTDERFKKWLDGDLDALPPSALKKGVLTSSFRERFIKHRGCKCARCGWNHDFGTRSRHNEFMSALELSHINHNHLDMRAENLEVLCPNCHKVETMLNPVERGKGRWVAYKKELMLP